MSDDLGLTPQAAIRAFAFSSVPATPAPPPTATTPPPGPTAPPVVEPHSHAGLSLTEAKTMADWTREDVKKGKLTPEAAAKIFDDLGTPPEDRVTKDDARSEELKLIDAHFPMAAESEFIIPLYVPGQALAVIPKDVQAGEANVRGWLGPKGAGLSREMGQAVIAAGARTVQHTHTMTPDERENYGYAEFAKLEKAYGDTLDERLRLAGRMVEEIEKTNPGLKDFLRSPIGDDAMVAKLLIDHAPKYWARRKGR